MKKTISLEFDRIYTIIQLSCLKTISLVLVLALGLIASVAKADFTFGTPTNLGPNVNSSAHDGSPDISADGLTLYFDSYYRPGGLGRWDIWVTTAQTKDGDWDTAVPLPTPVNSEFGDSGPCISADGLSLYFASDRPGTYGSYDIWVTTRPALNDPWGEPINLGLTVNSEAYDNHPSISTDGLSLYFDSYRPDGYGSADLYVTVRPTTSDPWGPPVNLKPAINTYNRDYSPNISTGGLALFFDIRITDRDIWMTTRRTADDDWGKPVNLGPPVNTSYDDTDPSICFDGSMLYFGSYRPGGVAGQDLWQVPIEPVVDFNGDGIVDIDDLLILIEHWDQDEPSVDIGPMPWGDGIVDVQDLIVLAKYIDPALIAHWKLDETEGVIAHDSAGNNDASVYGPVWQPDGGMVAGALQFDGIDDYVSTEFVLDPADGEFSVFAWVKGGGPGEVIISQTGGTTGYGSTWLGIDASEGKLITKLMFFWLPLESESVITDDAWHRVGVVWDGAHRYLYLDGTEVSKDTSPFSTGFRSDGGLYFGTGNNLEPGSFFSGLIDDVRIYNRAVSP